MVNYNNVVFYWNAKILNSFGLICMICKLLFCNSVFSLFFFVMGRRNLNLGDRKVEIWKFENEQDRIAIYLGKFLNNKILNRHSELVSESKLKKENY